MGTAQLAITTFLKENNGEADIDAAELARINSLTTPGIIIALHSLLKLGVIKKALEDTKKMSTRYTLIGELPVVERKTVVRRSNGLNGNLMERAMEQIANLRTVQEQMLAAGKRIEELEKENFRLKKENESLKEELQTTDAQLLEEQKKFLDMVQAAEKNSKAIKKIEFDGRGYQRTFS